MEQTFLSYEYLLTIFLFFAEEIGCFVNGECTESPYVQDWSVTDAQECLQLCQKFDGCEYFTYYGLDDYCLGFSACVELSQGSCQECYSGNATCPGNCNNNQLAIKTLYFFKKIIRFAMLGARQLLWRFCFTRACWH